MKKSKNQQAMELKEILESNKVVLAKWRNAYRFPEYIRMFLTYSVTYGFPHLKPDCTVDEAWREIEQSLLHRTCKVCSSPIVLKPSYGFVRYLENWICSGACAMKAPELGVALYGATDYVAKADPDPDQIAKACRQIQERWSEAQWESRAAGNGSRAWMPPELPTWQERMQTR